MSDNDQTPSRRRNAQNKRMRADEEMSSPPETSVYRTVHENTPREMPTSLKDPNGRFDNSLGLLTRKFLHLLRTSPDGTLDLNAAAAELDVQKRRIYDITNVLEGINLIEKQSKNVIVWKGNGLQESEVLNEELSVLRSHRNALEVTRDKLDHMVSDMEKMLHRTTQAAPAQMYMRYDDVLSKFAKQGEIVLAIRGLAGTTLEVPDPDEGMVDGKRRFEMRLRSERGPIDVFLLSQLPPTSTIEHFQESVDENGEALPPQLTDVGSVREYSQSNKRVCNQSDGSKISAPTTDSLTSSPYMPPDLSPGLGLPLSNTDPTLGGVSLTSPSSLSALGTASTALDEGWSTTSTGGSMVLTSSSGRSRRKSATAKKK